MKSKPTDSVLLNWIRSDDLEKFGTYLVSGVVHGKPGLPTAELNRIDKIIQNNLTNSQKYILGKKLLNRPEYTSRNLASRLITAGWPQEAEVESLLKKSADDADWIVREYAAGAFGLMLRKDFSYFSKQFLKWAKTENTNIKRAVALGVRVDAHDPDPKKWKAYFKIVDRLMSEGAEYVRINLGPFTVGDKLLSRFPDEVLSACQKWVKSKNENVLWNTAMIFTAAAARKHFKQGQKILKEMSKNPSPFVARAIKKAQLNLAKSS